MLRNLKFYLLHWVFLFSLLSCSQESALIVDQASTQENEFRLIDHDFIELFNSDDSIVYDVKNLGVAPVKLILVFEGERSVLSVANRRSEIQLNYFYDSDIETARKHIKFFETKNGKEKLVLYPVITEEFSTFDLVRFDVQGKFKQLGTHTYGFEDFEKVAEQIPVGNYTLRTIDDTVRVVLQSTPEMVLSRIWFGEESYFGETEKSPVQTYFNDLDNDGREDKIVVYRNESLQDEFDRDHFGLNVAIYRGTKDGLVLWTANNEVIFPFVDNCVCEGFEEFEVNDNQLVLYQQACRDYNMLIDATTTFELRGKDIVLIEYREEYFNKADHEEEISTRKWTSSDFGIVKFEDITRDLWRKLRGY